MTSCNEQSFGTSLLVRLSCVCQQRREVLLAKFSCSGLNILDLLDRFRDAEDEALLIQCDVFLDEKQNDDDDLDENNKLLDLDNHQQVFSAIFQKVRRRDVITLLHSCDVMCIVLGERYTVRLAASVGPSLPPPNRRR